MQPNLDYRILPPGRLRRMTYSREHRTRSESYTDLNLEIEDNFFSYGNSIRHESLANIDLGDPFHIDVEDFSNYRYPMQSLINPLYIEQEQDNEFFSYESLSRLSDVKKGLISIKLLNNSIVYHNSHNNHDYSDSYNEFCVICQMTSTKTCIMRKLLCNHGFHINCIDEWFTLNKTCPICKFEIK